MNHVSRRGFLVGSSAALFAAGCRSVSGGWGAPNLRFGVVSDIHVTTPRSTKLFVKALEHFKACGVDAVMVPGDLTDWGNRSSLWYVKKAWDCVFAGTDVVPLFCTGNHDHDGWQYGDMTMEMHANGYHEREAMRKLGVAKCWSEIFGESYAGVRVREVKGYSFVSAEWRSFAAVEEWMARHGEGFRGDKPFFYFQHYPIGGTTGDSKGQRDNVFNALKDYPNAIAFTGHTHTPFNDERSIWQGEFTAIAVPSLSYAYIPRTYENGTLPRNGTSTSAMQLMPDRRDLRGGQGYVVSVYDDEMTVERIDIEEGCVQGAETWVVPLPVKKERPYEIPPRANASVAPQFNLGTIIDTETRNTENRQGKWTVVLDCRFPAAVCADGARVHHYELSAVTKAGEVAHTWKFVTPGYSRLPKYEPKKLRFWMDVSEMPQETEYTIEARAYNCFGKASEPIVSRVWYSEPGLGKFEK